MPAIRHPSLREVEPSSFYGASQKDENSTNGIDRNRMRCNSAYFDSLTLAQHKLLRAGQARGGSLGI